MCPRLRPSLGRAAAPACPRAAALLLPAVGLGGRGGSGIWVSVAWGLAVLVVGEVSVVASASVLGLHTAAGAVCRRLPGQALSFYTRNCAGY